MQTFLPYPGFANSARVLDRQRLGKQRVEAYQILRALRGVSTGWVNHPATKMWRGYENALCLYGINMCIEWVSRGYKDTLMDKFIKLADPDPDALVLPPWLGDFDLHASHRSNLLRKDPAHYSQFGWVESDDLPYVWPA